jgi:hypothetical protein
MEFISAEEFLKQPEEVQKVLKDWWKPEIGDLYTFSGKDINNDKQAWAIGSELEAEICRKAKGIKIPLLAEGQLRQFIEDKTEGRVGSEYSLNGYTIYLWGELTTENDANSIDDYWETERIDLMSSYWDVACEIAEREE